jgi:hypothetical protein
VAEKAFSQPTYVYAAVDEEENEVGLGIGPAVAHPTAAFDSVVAAAQQLL